MSEDFESRRVVLLASLPAPPPVPCFLGVFPTVGMEEIPAPIVPYPQPSSCGASEPAVSLPDSRQGGKPSSQQPGAVTRTPGLNIDSQACNLPSFSTLPCL